MYRIRLEALDFVPKIPYSQFIETSSDLLGMMRTAHHRRNIERQRHGASAQT
jgi:hypothetical protein